MLHILSYYSFSVCEIVFIVFGIFSLFKNRLNSLLTFRVLNSSTMYVMESRKITVSLIILAKRDLYNSGDTVLSWVELKMYSRQFKTDVRVGLVYSR